MRKVLVGLSVLIFCFSCVTDVASETTSIETSGVDSDESVSNELIVIDETLSAHELYQLAVEQVKANNFDVAEVYLLRARQLNGDNASYALYLGWLYIHHFNDPGNAVIHLEDALKLDPSKKHLWTNLSRTYRALERWQDAAAAYEQAFAETGSTNALYVYEAGRMHYKIGNSEKGILLMGQAWQHPDTSNSSYIQSGYADHLYREARLQLEAENYDSAKKYFELLNNFIEQIEYDDRFMLNHFASYFYSIDYIKVIDSLKAIRGNANSIEVQILSVFPSSLESNTEELDRIKLARNLAAKLIVVLSEGNLRLQYEDVFLSDMAWELVTHKSYTTGENWGELDVVSAKETARTLLPALVDKGVTLSDFNSLFVYFSPDSFDAPRPSASVLFRKDFIQFFGERKELGFISFPLISYHASEGVYVHEYFHLLENLYRISPKHGFSPDHHYTENKRAAFPGWKGSGQFPYYQYHFIHTIAPAGYDRALHP